MSEPDRVLARRLAQESLARGDAIGWFDTLYDAAQGDEKVVPWADMRVHPKLIEWLSRHADSGSGQRALVIGCGLGDDAEELARRGYRVTAFDIAPRAIEWCQRRFPGSSVDYCVGDILAPPAAWHAAFDFVLEIFTLQVLPPELRGTAIAVMADCVAANGTLLLVARARDVKESQGTMPWPLVKEELAQFGVCGLETMAFDDYFDDEQPPVRRFRAEYRRPV